MIKIIVPKKFNVSENRIIVRRNIIVFRQWDLVLVGRCEVNISGHSHFGVLLSQDSAIIIYTS